MGKRWVFRRPFGRELYELPWIRRYFTIPHTIVSTPSDGDVFTELPFLSQLLVTTSAAIIYLPDAATLHGTKRWAYKFYVSNPAGLWVVATHDNTIRNGPTEGAPNGMLTSYDVGSYIELFAADDDHVVVRVENPPGSWTLTQGIAMSECGGRFILHPGTKREAIVPNTIVGDGANAFLQKLFQDADNLPASFFIGVTEATYTFTAAALTTIAAGEPVGNGYARQEVPRDGSNWDVDVVNNVYRARSAVVQFTASGLWTVEWTRAFLCSVVSGTSGIVFALSKAIVPQQVLAADDPKMAYEFWWRA